MRIDVREPGGDNPTPWTNPRLGRIDVDPVARPNLVRLPALPTDTGSASGSAAGPTDGPTERSTDRSLSGSRPASDAGPSASRESGVDRFLNWDGAIDDGGHLRKCVICGCDRLYRRKVLPQVTPFVVLLAFAGAIIGLLGYTNNPLMLPGLVVLLVIDVATLALARERLVCYRCGSVYSKLKIARYHRRWDRSEAERVRTRAGGSAGTTVASQAAS